MLKKILFVFWVVVVGSGVFYIVTHHIGIADIQAYIRMFGPWAILGYVLAYTIRPLIFFPTSIMTPASVVIFGPVLGWIFTYVGETLSASLAFFVGRYFGREFVKQKAEHYAFLKKYDQQMTQHGFMTVVILRLIPLFPFDFVNYVSGLSGIRYSRYLIGTLVGVLPGLTAYIFLGASILNPKVLIPTIVVFILLTVIGKTIQKRFEQKNSAPITS